MNRQQRTKLIEFQSRAYTKGTIEYINNQWVFFEEETDEASLLEEFLHQEVEVLRHSHWKKGILFEEGKLQIKEETLFLNHSDTIRIRKKLPFSLEQLLDKISDDAFYQFVTHLNSLRFSVYDCIYCYNHLNFLEESKRKEGVNFLVFDNQETICNVQHHFGYYEREHDRFEFTLNNGKRTIIEKIS